MTDAEHLQRSWRVTLVDGFGTEHVRLMAGASVRTVLDDVLAVWQRELPIKSLSIQETSLSMAVVQPGQYSDSEDERLNPFTKFRGREYR